MKENNTNKIEAVILYCSNDFRFFKTSINNLLSLGIKCNVITYTHLWAGEPENETIINQSLTLFRNNPNFKHKRLEWTRGYASFYWEAFGRFIGSRMVDSDCSHILFLDTDEIIDPEAAKLWFERGIYKKYLAMKLKLHVYHMDGTHRLRKNRDYALIAEKIHAQTIEFKPMGRLYYFNNNNRISRWLAKLHINPFFAIQRGEAFIHHYTWARPKEEMLRKVTNWGHNVDRPDWADVIEGAFTIRNNRIGKHKFITVENKFNFSDTEIAITA